MKILVTGKTGQLAKSIYALISSSDQKHKFAFIGREELDLNQNKSIESFFHAHHYDVVVNCAAYTAVDNAENESKTANQVNHIAVSKLAGIAKKQGFKIIHISTDYVFDGKASKPYREDDKSKPINVYGQSKLNGERAMQKILTHGSIIIRTSGLYSVFGENFVKKIINLSKTKNEINVINNQFISPTYSFDLAEAIISIVNSKKFYIKNQKTQIYHFCSSEEVSWYEFAKIIFKSAKINKKISPCDKNDFPSLAKRPDFSVLNSDKIEIDYNIKIPSINNSLIKLFEFKSSLNKPDI